MFTHLHTHTQQTHNGFIFIATAVYEKRAYKMNYAKNMCSEESFYYRVLCSVVVVVALGLKEFPFYFYRLIFFSSVLDMFVAVVAVDVAVHLLHSTNTAQGRVCIVTL